MLPIIALASVLAATPTSATAAPICPTAAQTDTMLAASWGLHYTVSGGHGQQGELDVLRRGDDTALFAPNRAVSEWWSFRDAKRPTFRRVFTDMQRRIEYTTGDLRTLGVHADASEITSFATAHLLTVLTRQPTASDCAGSELYTGTFKDAEYRLQWQPQLHLPLTLTITRNGETTRWQADGTLDATAVDGYFHQWLSYEDTDFADIGDKENDPFLAKLINQGFIEHSGHAAYNSDGTIAGELGGGHQHAH